MSERPVPQSVGHLGTDEQALADRRVTGCAYDIGLCLCPSAPFEYEGCRVRGVERRRRDGTFEPG